MITRARRLLLVGAILLGAAGAMPTTHAAVLAQAGAVEILFTPGDAIDRRIIAAIEAARDQIHVLAYAFTHQGIANALVAARARGVEVMVVADRVQALELPHTVLPDLRRRGIAVWLDRAAGNAHNKVMIVDPRSVRPTTITGSYNFTRAAQTHNAENVVIFHGNRDVARLYERYFQRRRGLADAWGADGPRIARTSSRARTTPGAGAAFRRAHVAVMPRAATRGTPV